MCCCMLRVHRDRSAEQQQHIAAPTAPSPQPPKTTPKTNTHQQRKVAALEVEQVVKRLAASGDHHRIRAIIDKLIAEFAFSPQANHRKVRL